MGKLRPSGGYRELRSFQTATLVYDGTYWFCERFLASERRLCEQMVMAARSGRQNIAEGSRASATSSQTELRLANVARSSLEELLLDSEDYLRQRHLRQWGPDDPEAMAVRRIGQEMGLRRDRTDRTDQTDRTDRADRVGDEARYALYAKWLDSEDAAVRANALLCLIHQVNTLLDRQIEALEARFIEGGGYSEQLAAERLAERARRERGDQADQTDRTDRTDQTDRAERIPRCPLCGKAMVLRTAQKGRRTGKQFWGCSGYPRCTGAVDV